MKLTKKIRHGIIATVLAISPLSTVLAQIQPVLTANVGYIDGHVQRYNGVATATVLTESYTTTINYSSSLFIESFLPLYEAKSIFLFILAKNA
ncbi:hypothetical protein [uncultured Lactobacillus sp.]|uniref:hypothetical protein n=1 Tax=uncultured Lactobacillus sp. TaxID=153152 RepID=UPI0025D5D916|nr:hypothetical protein [uncultured Lactobacillus sp.]